MSTVAQSAYLDYNATAPIRPEVAVRMADIMGFPANASSAHRYGRQAKKILEDSRAAIAAALNCWPNEIIFIASGTEANNLALRSQPTRRVIASAVEHSSVLKAVAGAELIPVDSRGIVRLNVLEKMLKETSEPALVSIMLANNETGVIQPIREAAEICHKNDALLHCDAVQGLGKIPVDFTQTGADMLTLSAHKCGGPLGAAALVLRNNLAIQPMLLGGGQELGRRAGTENIAAIAGFGLACELAQDLSFMQVLRGWLDGLESRCEALGGTVHGKGAARLPNTVSLSMPGVSSETQLMHFDLAGYAVSAGSACSSGRIEPSHVLAAMEVAPEIASCSIRVSAGWNSTEEELLRFAAEWEKTRLRLGLNHANQSGFQTGFGNS